MEVETLRMIERILSVVVGGFSIYLGFHLFRIIPHVDTGGGKFVFPGGSVHLTRTGPGVFFALFGCAIIFWSFSYPIDIGSIDVGETPQHLTANRIDQKGEKQTYFHGIASTTNEPEEIINTERLNVINDIQYLNRLESYLDNYAESGKFEFKQKYASSVVLAIPRMKRLMMQSVWSKEWGDFAKFAKWAKKGNANEIPKGIEVAVEYYLKE